MSELIFEPRHTAVVVIDLQKGIVEFPGNPHSTSSVIANTVVLLDAARTKKRGVTIFSAFAPAISFLLASDQWRVIHNGILRH